MKHLPNQGSNSSVLLHRRFRFHREYEPEAILPSTVNMLILPLG